MAKYRIANNLPSKIKSNTRMDLYRCYGLLTPRNDFTWSPVAPSPEELAKQPWYNVLKYVDPNEINEKMGMPPYYAVIPVAENLHDWVVKNFKVEKFYQDAVDDIIFEGEYQMVKK